MGNTIYAQLKALKDKIRQQTKRTCGKSLNSVIRTLNPMLRGWFEYFKHGQRLNIWMVLSADVCVVFYVNIMENQFVGKAKRYINVGQMPSSLNMDFSLYMKLIACQSR